MLDTAEHATAMDREETPPMPLVHVIGGEPKSDTFAKAADTRRRPDDVFALNGDETLQKLSDDSLLNREGISLHNVADIESRLAAIRDKVQIVLPVYNQETTLQRTLDYLINDLGIPPEQIVAASCSTDGSNNIIKASGVNFVDQDRVLEDLLKKGAFLDLMQADSLHAMRGKGLTMLSAQLYRYLSGMIKPGQWVLQTDTDIRNIGANTSEGEWDPIRSFAWAITQDSTIEAIHASKIGRDNQNIHVLANTLPGFADINPHALTYHTAIATRRWPLTGEYGWLDKFTTSLRTASGYAVETVLHISQADLGMIRKQIEIPELRRDMPALMERDTILFSDIQQVVNSIVLTGKSFHELTATDIRNLNAKLVKIQKMFFAHESDKDKGSAATPNTVTNVGNRSRVIPDLNTLRDLGILYSGN